jgi:uncharacterized membrane protein YidH (DUF202 family)
MNVKNSKDEMGITINKVQLILAEKRTSLAVMRTGIAVFVLPLSVLSALVATSKFYDFIKVIYLMIPLLLLCAGMIALGAYLVIRAIIRIKRFDRVIKDMKKENKVLSQFLCD